MADEGMTRVQSSEASAMDMDNQSQTEEQEQSSQKVELDLDDAPFLQWEEEEAEQDHDPGDPGVSSEPEGQEAQASRSPWRKNRMIIGLAGLLILGVLVLTWILFRQQDLAPSELNNQEPVESKPAETIQKPEQIHFEPFWVEYDGDSGFRYLHFEFALRSDHEKLSWEIDRKRFVIRDAIYYYLKNKKLAFFLDKGHASTLKTDLASVVNQYLSNGKVQNILIQDFVVD